MTKLARMSLRLRWTASTVVLFLVVMLVLGLATSHVRADLQREAFDADLRAGAREVAERFSSLQVAGKVGGEVPVLLRERTELVPNLFRVIGKDGVVAAESRSEWHIDWPFDSVPTGFGGFPQYATVTGTPGPESILAPRPMRVVGLPVRDGQGADYIVQVARDPVWLASADAFAANFYWFAVPIALCAAAIASWLQSGHATRQMIDLTNAASVVSPRNMKLNGVQLKDSEIADLHTQLTAAFARIEAGFVAQSRFLGDVAHELKTPLAVAAAQAQWIAAAPKDSEEVTRLAQSIDEDVRQLASLVDGLLLLARAFENPSEVPPEPVELHDVVTEAVRRTRALCRQRNVRLVARIDVGSVAEDESHGLDPALPGNEELLIAMLDNVLRNAIRYSPPGGRVDLTAANRSDGWEIVVRDFGPGVPEDQLEAIFERFFRVRGRSEGAPGNGIGLTIAQRVAMFHGGSVSASNAEGGGLQVAITLPRDIPSALSRIEPGQGPSFING